MGLTISLLDKKNEVQELIWDSKKAKINWIMTVTQLTFDELEDIANELGFVIKGEFIALPEEAKKIADPDVKRPKRKSPAYSREELANYNLLYCPRCAIILKEAEEKADLVGYCPSCGLDFKDIFRMDKEDGYFQKRCNNCHTINPVKVAYCFKCGNKGLTRIVPVSKTARKIHPKRGSLRPEMIAVFIASFIFSVGIIIWAVVEITQDYGIMTRGLAIAAIVIGSLLLSVPAYYLYRFSMWREYQRYKWYFSDD